MDEDLIRAIVRQSIARHLGGSDAGSAPDSDAPLQPAAFVRHSSHYRYALPKAGDACVIEPNVRCNHCGYCESHGH